MPAPRHHEIHFRAVHVRELGRPGRQHLSHPPQQVSLIIGLQDEVVCVTLQPHDDILQVNHQRGKPGAGQLEGQSAVGLGGL